MNCPVYLNSGTPQTTADNQYRNKGPEVTSPLTSIKRRGKIEYKDKTYNKKITNRQTS